MSPNIPRHTESMRVTPDALRSSYPSLVDTWPYRPRLRGLPPVAAVRQGLRCQFVVLERAIWSSSSMLMMLEAKDSWSLVLG